MKDLGPAKQILGIKITRDRIKESLGYTLKKCYKGST